MPVSAHVTAMCRIVINNAPLALQAMIVEHERDTRSWRLDWHHIPENSILLSKALKDTIHLIGNLTINEKNVEKNLQLKASDILVAANLVSHNEQPGDINFTNFIGQSERQVDEVIKLSNSQSEDDASYLSV